MRLLWVLVWTCALGPFAANGQALSAALTFVFNILQQQLKVTTQRRGVPLIVPEPPPSLVQQCRLANLPACDLHAVHTLDGYILGVLHVPPVAPEAVPVLVMHGSMGTSDGYLMRRDGSNLANVLHEAGYDVWLGNWRGNTHSLRHERLNSSDPKFFEFSIHELGVYDMPALVDYVLKYTNQPSLHIMGHSMGCPAILVGLSWHPEYNSKIRFAALLAPVIWPRNTLEVLSRLLFETFYHPFRAFVKETNMWNMLPRTAFMHNLSDVLCRDDSPTIELCRMGFELVFGPVHPTQRMKNFMPHLTATHPAGSSFNINYQYTTISISGRFRPTGKGPRDPNPPPDYNLTSIATPVGLYYGASDATMSVKDMEPLGRSLPSLEDSYLVPLEKFNHFDFLTAKDVRGLLYDRLLQTMKNVDFKTMYPGF